MLDLRSPNTTVAPIRGEPPGDPCRRIHGVLAGVALLISSFAAPCAPTSSATYYVDPERGKDANDGTSLTSPFKTIARARDVLRGKNKVLSGDITVYLRGGVYFQENTLEFTDADGGAGDGEIIYRNYKDEVPEISGGQRIAGWQIFDNSKNIFRAKADGFTFRQLYINGNWGIRARTPNGAQNTDIQWDAEHLTIRIGKNNIAQWRNFNKVEMVTLNAWTGNHLRLQGFTTDSDYAYVSIQPEERCVFHVAAFAFQGKEYFFENAYEFLDSEGEWYLDAAEHFVYYKPRAGEDMANAEVIAPRLENIVRIEGKSLDLPVSHLQFHGISFMHSTWLRPDAFGNVEMQAAQYFMPNSGEGAREFTGRPASAVMVKNANQVHFERCLFANLGATALDLISGVHESAVIGNVFRDIAGNAVAIGLTAKETEPNITAYRPADARELPANVSVKNNYITRVGKDNIGAVGVMYAYARDIRVESNEIEDVPYTGISGGWGWNSAETPMRDNTISRNHIHNYMKVFYDGAGVYTLSAQPNSVCSENYIENKAIGARGYGWNALYADEGTRHLTIRNNVCEVRQHDKIQWLALQSVGQGAKECPVNNNYTTSTSLNDNNGQPVSGTHYFPKADWPQEAKDIINRAGLEPAYKDIKNKWEPPMMAKPSIE